MKTDVTITGSLVFSGLLCQSDAKQYGIDCKYVMELKREIGLPYFVKCNPLNEIK